MRKLIDLAKYTSLNPSQLADTIFHCPECSQDHKIPFKVVKDGQYLVSLIPDLIQEAMGWKPEKICFIYDKHIEEKLEVLFFEAFSRSEFTYQRFPLVARGELLDASVELGDQTAENLPDTIDFLVGLGSGVISDLTKWIATDRKLPFMLIGTAASMNAYTSITGTMTENNVKTSKWLDPASIVLLDSELLASAPVEMTHAGLGDILARNVANADWKLSEILRGTYFCPVPFQMMSKCQDDLIPSAHRLGNNDIEALDLLGKAVLTSGYSMTVLNGETSPSSGSEHIISHFFDFQHELFGLPKNLHGTQVGIGTIIMSKAYDMLRSFNPEEFDIDDLERRRLSMAAVRLDHKRVFGEKSHILNDVVKKKRISDVEYRPYIQKILGSWDDIWYTLDAYLMPAETILATMEKAGAVTKLSGVNRSPEEAIQALLYGSHYRIRYTLLDLLWELGLFPEIAPVILDQSGVLN